MTSSTSSSSRGRALALALAAAMAGCSALRREAPRAVPGESATAPAARVAVLPPANLSASTVPLRELGERIREAVAAGGFEVASDEEVQKFLAAHRLRQTAGIDGASAAAARAELGVTAILLTAVEAYAPGPPPRLSLTMRLVAAADGAGLLWMEGASRTGDEAPGLFDRGLIEDEAELQRLLVGRLARRLAAALRVGGPPGASCDGPRRLRPRIQFRSPLLDPGRSFTVAVVPFRNLTPRRGAGEVVALAFGRELSARAGFLVLEPGVVRETLLRQRLVLEGGVSLDQVRSIVGGLGADLVVVGDVLRYDDGMGGAPHVAFLATVIEGASGEIVWQSTSENRGDEGLVLFGLGDHHTAEALTCGMASALVGRFWSTVPVRLVTRPARGSIAHGASR